MNTIDPREQDDAAERDAISTAYRASRDADDMLPPSSIDDAIRAAARRAVQSGPRAAGAGGFARWTRKWTPQLSAAAVVVLSVSVIFVSMQERPDLASLSATISTDRFKEKQSAAMPHEGNLVMDTKIVQEAAVPPPQMTFVPEPEAAKKRDAGSADAYNIVLPAPKISSNAAEERKQRDRIAAAAESKVPAPEVMTNVPAPAPVLSAPAAVAPPVYAPPAAPAPATAPPPMPYRPTASQSGSVLSYGGAVDHKFAKVVPPAEPAPEPKLLQKKEAAAEVSAADALLREKTVADQVRRTESAAVAAAPVPPPTQVAAQAAAPSASMARAAPTAASRADIAQMDAVKAKDASPAAGKPATGASASEASGPWLKRMLELREQGKLKELREELVRFKKAYPDFVLPKTLADLPAE